MWLGCFFWFYFIFLWKINGRKCSRSSRWPCLAVCQLWVSILILTDYFIYRETQGILTTMVPNTCQWPISCSSEGRQMDADFKLPATTARTPPIACRQDHKPPAAVSIAPVGWCVCTALPCWACASGCPNTCCTSCRRRPAGFLFEQKAALQSLQKHYCLSVCAARNADVQWLFTSEMIPCLLCATPGRKFCYR